MGLYKGIYGLGFTKSRSIVLWGLIGSLTGNYPLSVMAIKSFRRASAWRSRLIKVLVQCSERRVPSASCL